jgi:uncharacterized protein DUF5107
LENDQSRVTISPGLGGKVFSMIHKPCAKEVLYVPDVIRYTKNFTEILFCSRRY